MAGQGRVKIERREKLENRMERIKELYKWDDISREEYTEEKQHIQGELNRFNADGNSIDGLEKLAEFLMGVSKPWGEASQEQRSKLARCLFQEVWVKDKIVIAVKPQLELAPFFELNYDEFVNERLKMRPRGDSNPRSPP